MESKRRFSTFKALDTDIVESLKAASGQAPEALSVISKHFDIDVIQVIVKIFAEFKYGAAKIRVVIFV